MKVRSICLITCALVASSCTKSPRAVYHYDPALPSQASVSEERYPKAPPSGEFLYSESPEVQRAVEEFVENGKAPIIKRPGFLEYPYGESQPIIYCQPLRACDIELQAGEEILGMSLGDKVRWSMNVCFGDAIGQNLATHIKWKFGPHARPGQWGQAVFK